MAGRQTGKNIRVAFKQETTFNTAPDPATGAEVLRLNPSPGLQMQRATITPNEVRQDGQVPLARLGSRTVTGNYAGDLSYGSFDTVLGAIMRTSVTTNKGWVAAADVSGLTVTDNATSGGSKLAKASINDDLSVGDVVTAGGVNARVVSIASGNTSAEVSNRLATSTVTVKRQRRLTQGSPRPTRRSFWVEQYYQDLDRSVAFGGARFHGFTLRGAPDGMATIDLPITAVSQTLYDDAGDAPFYPAALAPTTTDGLTFVDARIKLAADDDFDTEPDIGIATSFEMTMATPASTLPIIGGVNSPDVFDEESTVSGSVTMLRDSLARVKALDAETRYELFIILEDTVDAPKNFIGIYVPRLKFTSVDAPLGGAGALVETVGWSAGKDNDIGSTLVFTSN